MRMMNHAVRHRLTYPVFHQLVIILTQGRTCEKVNTQVQRKSPPPRPRRVMSAAHAREPPKLTRAD